VKQQKETNKHLKKLETGSSGGTTTYGD